MAVVFCFCCTISVTTKADVGIDDFAADSNLLFFVISSRSMTHWWNGMYVKPSSSS